MLKRFNIHEVSQDGGSNSFEAFRSRSAVEILRDSFFLITPENSGSETLALGQTTIYPGCRSAGHSHDDREEVYFFLQGKGVMTVGREECEVGPGDAVFVPYGEFHSTRNVGQTVLDFIWVTSRKVADGRHDRG